ncbi:hypothetical protein [Dokdonella sp.]|uniref:hypothetical protein n=1 Tax=Dokdonella sp. TaxID=2291710 RepID=UPI003527CAB5
MAGLHLSLAVIGLLLMLGGYLDWEFLTDPPKLMAICYSQAFLRLIFSRHAMRWVTAIEGFLIFIGSCWGMVRLLQGG